jgi:hypothetical protein
MLSHMHERPSANIPDLSSLQVLYAQLQRVGLNRQDVTFNCDVQASAPAIIMRITGKERRIC